MIKNKKNGFVMPKNGYELAKMLGFGDVYERGLRKQRIEEMKFSNIANKVLKELDNKE